MERITVDELKNLEKECLARVQSDHLYSLRNDAKLRAVNSSKTYDEFKFVVFDILCVFLVCICDF